MILNKVVLSSLCIVILSLSACTQSLNNKQIKPVSEHNDNIIHTTVYHNYQHKTLSFIVTFDIGYYDKAGNCIMKKRRVFTASHKNKARALTLGHHLANEYGPSLFNCVHENLHVFDSKYPDEAMTYTLTHNGSFYTHATPNVKHVHPR